MCAAVIHVSHCDVVHIIVAPMDLHADVLG